MRPLFTTGFEDEPIDWKLISQSTINGHTLSMFEAPSKKHNKVYCLLDVSGEDITVSQHMFVR